MSDQEQRPKRTIDERIDALTMGMELHSSMMRDVDVKLDRLAASDERLTEKIDKIGTAVDKLAVTVNELTGVVQMLAGVVHNHERRLESLEGQPQA